MSHRYTLILCMYLGGLAASLLAQDTDNALPLVTGNMWQCSCSGDTVDQGCMAPGATLRCPQNCSYAGQKPNDACQPFGADCQRPAKVTSCSTPIPEGKYLLKMDMKVDSGELDCLNSRTQDKHHRLQQYGCTYIASQSVFFLDQKDAQGCYTLRPTGQSPNTVLGVLVDGDDRYVAEMGMKPNCQAGQDQYHWNLIPVDTPQGKRYKIQNKLTGWCINADKNTAHGGGKVQPLDYCINDESELFNLEKVQ
jgi:hypothetical protein